MKILTLHIAFLVSLCGFSQMSNNSITIRKLTSEVPLKIIRYSDIMSSLDSSFNYKKEDQLLTLKGLGGRDWLFEETKVHFFHNYLNRRMRRLAINNKTKFWKLVNKKELLFETVKINATQDFYGYRTYNSVFNYKYEIDRNSNDTLLVEKIIIDSNRFSTIQNTTITNVAIRNDTFYIGEGDEYLRWGWLWNNRKHFDSRLTYIRNKCRDQKKSCTATGYYKCNKKVNSTKLDIHLTIDGSLAGKMTVYENYWEPTLCEYEIINDSIFISEPPYEFLAKGKFNRKKSSVRFRDKITRKSYIFRIKRNVLDKRVSLNRKNN